MERAGGEGATREEGLPGDGDQPRRVGREEDREVSIRQEQKSLFPGGRGGQQFWS
jgi:hypothetical protein